MKTLLSSIALAAGIACGGGVSAQTVTNEGRIMSSTQVFASVNGNGGSLSHAETHTGATANGAIAAPSAGNIALAGSVSGFTDISAYNTAYGSGVGEAGGRTWSDARVHGALATAIPSGTGQIAIDVEAGFRDPMRNGSDVTVMATTSRDGFVQAMYEGAATANLAMSAAPIAGGTAIAGTVVSTSSQHSEVVAGGITFAGGTPVGQAAAVRFGQAGVQVDTSGSFIDPVGK